MTAFYVHHLNPVLLRFSEKIALRWYGLAYLAGFLAGYRLLVWLSRRRLWVLGPAQAADFVAGAAMFGVFLGGRLGYIVLYQLFDAERGWGQLARDPFLVLRVWEGGMASHGGILGLVIYTWFHSRSKKVSWTGLGDGVCVVAPLGLLFGRIANFINGELYGRVADGVSWAMKFPLALMDSRAPESARFFEASEAAVRAAPQLRPQYDAMLSAWEMYERTGSPDALPQAQMRLAEARAVFFDALMHANRTVDGLPAALGEFLLPRHPSQLYEGALEGLALFAILFFVRVRNPRLPHGVLTGLFFLCYAVFRISAEQFREPDAALMSHGLLTKGQYYSVFMIAAGLAFLIHGMLRGTRPDEASPPPDDPEQAA